MAWHRAADQSVTDSVMVQFTDAYERNLVINKYDFRGQNIEIKINAIFTKAPVVYENTPLPIGSCLTSLLPSKVLA